MLDQPSGEMLRLERVLDAFAQYEELQNEKARVRARNRDRHK